MPAPDVNTISIAALKTTLIPLGLDMEFSGLRMRSNLNVAVMVSTHGNGSRHRELLTKRLFIGYYSFIVK